MQLHIMNDVERLNICDIKTPKWSFKGKKVKAKCVKVYDGDTATFVFIPHKGSDPCSFSCRFLGYDSPEIKSKIIEEKELAVKARDYLSSLILNQIVDLELNEFDKYGRILVNVYLPDGKHINTHMLELGHGRPYQGSGEKFWQQDQH
jgi:micrococcal nuclease